MISSRVFFVTSTDRVIRARGNSFRLAAVCMTAVKNACGLKNAPSQTEGGTYSSITEQTSNVKHSRHIFVFCST